MINHHKKEVAIQSLLEAFKCIWVYISLSVWIDIRYPSPHVDMCNSFARPCWRCSEYKLTCFHFSCRSSYIMLLIYVCHSYVSHIFHVMYDIIGGHINSKIWSRRYFCISLIFDYRMFLSALCTTSVDACMLLIKIFPIDETSKVN